jgi:hypothetical protein
MWFKIDDSLWGHPKWTATSLAARGLWVTAGAWCASQLQDGHVPAHMLAMLGGRRKEADELVRRGLWDCDDDGWRFHDWDQYQFTREEVLDKRKTERDKKRRQRRNDKGQYLGPSRNASPGDTPGDSRRESLQPVPSRPDPSSYLLTLVGRLQSRNADATTTTIENYAQRHAPHADLEAEAEEFLARNDGQWDQLRDPLAAWRAWIREAGRRNPEPAATEPWADLPRASDLARGLP